jgi:hypothetical protein
MSPSHLRSRIKPKRKKNLEIRGGLMSGRCTPQAKDGGMLAELIRRENARTYKTLMSGHAGEDYYLDRCVSVPSRWSGQSCSMDGLRKMQSRNLFFLAFDHLFFWPMRLYQATERTTEQLLSSFLTVPQARLGAAFAAGLAWAAILVAGFVLLQDCYQIARTEVHSLPLSTSLSKQLASAVDKSASHSSKSLAHQARPLQL